MDPATTKSAIYKILNFHPIGNLIKKFKDVYLHEIISSLGKTQFLDKAITYCWHLTYNDLNLTVNPAKDNCYKVDTATSDHIKEYLSQQMHSISGKQNDLYLYTYGYEDLNTFLQINMDRHYTFLPITVHAAESANDIRHDMLVIFNNRTKHFYWLDGNNRSDYLSFGKNIPQDAIDTLFINFAELAKTGYDYEPSQSWQFPGIFCNYASITEQLDFILSTVWCYLTVVMIDDYNTPMEFSSMLDGLSETDRFHLLYCTMIQLVNCPMHMVGSSYHNISTTNGDCATFTDRDVKLSQPSKVKLDSNDTLFDSTIEFKMAEPPRILNLVDDVNDMLLRALVREDFNQMVLEYKRKLQKLTDQEYEYDIKQRRIQQQMYQDNLINPDPEYEEKLKQLHQAEYEYTTDLRKRRQECHLEYQEYVKKYGPKCTEPSNEDGANVKIIGPIKVISESDVNEVPTEQPTTEPNPKTDVDTKQPTTEVNHNTDVDTKQPTTEVNPIDVQPSTTQPTTEVNPKTDTEQPDQPNPIGVQTKTELDHKSAEYAKHVNDEMAKILKKLGVISESGNIQEPDEPRMNSDPLTIREPSLSHNDSDNDSDNDGDGRCLIV